MSKNTTRSAGNGKRPTPLVGEALEGYAALIGEVYTEAMTGEHWAGVPDWNEYLTHYLAAEEENRRIEANENMPDIPKRGIFNLGSPKKRGG